MKKIIYFAILILILQGCSSKNNMDKNAQEFNPYNTVKVIERGKVYFLPIDSNYVFVDDAHKKLFTETDTFLECNLGNIFWRSPDFMKTGTKNDITPEYLKKAEKKLLAGCCKPTSKMY
ncbi:MAG: hypothetical protein L3J10_06855 [Sulfurimonas sp.]|nr:hypothetical protein [Sulfurimonas sp.]